MWGSNICVLSFWCLPITPTVHPFEVISLLMEKVMAPHSSTLAWKIPWVEEPGGLQSMGSLRIGHDWATSLSLYLPYCHWAAAWTYFSSVEIWGKRRQGQTDEAVIKTEGHLNGVGLNGVVGMEWILLHWSRIRSAYSSQSWFICCVELPMANYWLVTSSSANNQQRTIHNGQLSRDACLSPPLPLHWFSWFFCCHLEMFLTSENKEERWWGMHLWTQLIFYSNNFSIRSLLI